MEKKKATPKSSSAKTQIPEFCTSTDMAKLLGKTTRRIQQLRQDGILETMVPPEGGMAKYDVCKNVQAYIEHVEEKAAASASGDQIKKLSVKKLEAEILLKESQGQLHRLKTAIAEGRYISAEEASADLAEFLVNFKKMAITLPKKLALTLGNYTDSATCRLEEKNMRKQVEEMLIQFVDSAILKQIEEDEA